MNDHDFLTAFEAGTLHPFNHREHIRMAWLYLRRDGWLLGTEQIRAGIQRLAAAKGVTRLYHETITMFWAQMVYQALQADAALADFEQFAAANPDLFDKQLINRFYSPALINSEAARQTWIEPDGCAP